DAVEGKGGRDGDGGQSALGRGRGAARRLLARGELPLGGTDLPAREPPPARAAPPGAHQAAPARALRHDARPEPDLRAPEPRDPEPRPRYAVRDRAGPRRSGAGRERLPGRHLQRGLPAYRPRRGRAAGALSPVLVPG